MVSTPINVPFFTLSYELSLRKILNSLHNPHHLSFDSS
jgi:hypothetical protein